MDSKNRLELVYSALGLMGEGEGDPGPKPFDRSIKAVAMVSDLVISAPDLAEIWTDILGQDINRPAAQAFGRHLRRWDTLSSANWTEDTKELTVDRRSLIYRLLGVDPAQVVQLNTRFAIASPAGQPIVIAENHEVWYTPERRKQHSFYWDAYKTYLEDIGRWDNDGIDALDRSSTLIVERLSDPERREIYRTKGLVVGYVQSGKTANFTAVTAKAADAGYRLIIILAGTLNILREQTQRRIDKELIGREVIEENITEGVYDYANDRDWSRFIRHRALPSQLGAFDWERLTGASDDYSYLGHAIGALKFRKHVPGRRFNDPANLHSAPARLIVMKKTPAILRKLNKDLGRLRTALEEVPALVIDDESDQASVNTTRPTANEEKRRTATNLQIVRLLGLLPRAQYVGYTATPFANVFIDPADAEDLFPKDYIVALDRPSGYMGVSDFFDLADDGSPLADDERPSGFQSKERAFIRDVLDEDENDDNLPKALDSFILSGALKLYRKEHGVRISTEHHTMLVHRSVLTSDHESDKDLVEALYDRAGIRTKRFYDRLKSLWETDFVPVTSSQDPTALQPQTFEALRDFIDACVARLERDNQPVRIVNGDSKWEDQLPNFDRDSVWAVLVGGTKLSRGYTVEGLTISYYRRRIRTADTLMQVGRWFGFRRGYRDLVRLFIGRREPDGRDRTLDLYEAYKSICLDEEEFRTELAKYAGDGTDPPLKPRQVPPLVPSHMLLPTARNKMYNACLTYQNFGEAWRESGTSTQSAKGRAGNAGRLRTLLTEYGMSDLTRVEFETEQKATAWKCYISTVTPEAMIQFLSHYDRCDGRSLMDREIDFLRGTGSKDPEIDRWLVILPQKAHDDAVWWLDHRLSVFGRQTNPHGFNVFSELRHRLLAPYLAGLGTLPHESASVSALQKPRTAVMLCYPVVGRDYPIEKGEVVPDRDITIGFGLQFPGNKIPASVTFGVVDPTAADAITVNTPAAGEGITG